MDETVRDEILGQLDFLPVQEQMRVLEYARLLAASRRLAIPGRELSRFAGAIPKSDLDEMARAIAQGCERVDSNEW